MPTYEYECEACGHRFEKFQSITAKPEKKCPKCSKPRLRRLIGTGGALLFKGSGFYITDYRSDDYKQKAKSETPSPAKSTDGKAASGDAKPAAEAPKPAAKESAP